MRSVTLLLFFLPNLVFAECFVVGNLKGYSTREYEEYKVSEDGVSSQKFILEIKGDNSRVTPNTMSCMQMGSHSLFCFDETSEGQATIETWAVYPDKGKVVYTKSINGYGPLNGGNMFVGNINGECH